MHVLFTTATAMGSRRYQEDRYFTASTPEGTLVGVFDGHGGEQCSTLAARRFVELWCDVYEPGKDIIESTKEVFRQVGTAVNFMDEGTTASTLYIPHEGDDVYIGILGDSPVIVQHPAGATHISPEHNVRSNLKERAAAQERGGFYVSPGYICLHYMGPGLQMGRAFGNSHLQPAVTHEPEVYSTKMGKYALVASDGVLDPSHQKGGDPFTEVIKLLEAGADAQALVDRAVKLPTDDNATAIVVRSSKLPA